MINQIIIATIPACSSPNGETCSDATVYCNTFEHIYSEVVPFSIVVANEILILILIVRYITLNKYVFMLSVLSVGGGLF